MSLSFFKTDVEGVISIKPHVFLDKRGTYKKIYEKDVFVENGIFCEFTESSDIYSNIGVLRGLHYQIRQSQAKLVHVIKGAVFDVAVDLRINSPTFGKYHAEILDNKTQNAVYIPENFAHGFLSLTDNSIFSYQCSGRYMPSACNGIKWDDTTLKIPWPLEEYGIKDVIMTEKDAAWPTFEEYKKLAY